MRQQLDNRIDMYKRKVLLNNNIPCPRMHQLVISSSGEIQLCCADWLLKNKFGNVNQDTLKNILEHSDYLLVRDDLILGKRYKYEPCKKCI